MSSRGNSTEPVARKQREPANSERIESEPAFEVDPFLRGVRKKCPFPQGFKKDWSLFLIGIGDFFGFL
jgi:hypothetical protein